VRQLLPLFALLTSCAQPPPPVAVRDFKNEADALLHGLGATVTCRNDRDCQQGEVRAVCTLGTCFGLLTTDERVTRALLVERLAAADVQVQAAATQPLLEVLGNEAATNGQKIAAIDGLAAVLARTPNDEVQTLLRLFAAEKDETLAVTARLALGRLGDASVRAALLEDLTRGTELLRTEAARALQPAVADANVKLALGKALDDGSPVVQLAALRSLASVGRDPLVAGKLADLAAHAPAFRYEVEELLAGGGK
jgi:hypothetical protein